MVMQTPVNPELQLAGAYVRDTGCHIFLTGKAGTGKTTFLHSLKTDSPKRMVVTAPTGVAAINAGGVTLHSFFQLPFGPFLPGSEATHSQYRFSREKVDIIKNLDLLVIDEISMVRADLLDGVDSVLRRYRRREQPFGGVQLLMIGDLYQLPPVVRDEDWQLLSDYYATPYFFGSQALQQSELITIELKHIYRQADGHFINLLNQVRNAQVDPAAMDELNARHIPGFEPDAGEGYITLCTHNRNADAINDARLAAITGKTHTFKAEIDGDFPEHTYPTAGSLELKKGAQVMFVRNDLSPEKRYFNGKIGTITDISSKHIRIRCPEDTALIEVEPTTWDNIEYKLNRETQEISENKIGEFKQYPLRLAWAVTIHKSQGLTFDRAIIDAQAAFAHGQVYVALSRCRTLDGIVLSTPLSTRAIKTDAAVRQFSQQGRETPPTPEQLEAARIQYQQRLLLECFDFGRLRRHLRRLVSLLFGNASVVHFSGIDDLGALQRQTEVDICSVGDKFGRQLQGLFSSAGLPSADPAILERIAKASAYFQEKLAAGPARLIPELTIDTDNQALLKKINQARRLALQSIQEKLAAVGSCADGFSPAVYFRAVSGAETERAPQKKKTEKAAVTYRESDIAHADLFQRLKNWRSRKAGESGVPAFQVMHQKPLVQIAVHLPDTLDALKQIQGIGPQLAKRYGEELVAMVADYRRQHNIETVTLPDPPPQEAKRQAPPSSRDGGTRQVSLELFEKGATLDQIAETRGLAVSTIEGHMAHHVETGTVAVERLVPSAEKRRVIQAAFDQAGAASLRTVKEIMGEATSYAELKFVQAHLKFLSADGDNRQSAASAGPIGDRTPADES
ncbi:helicase [Desulfosarcina ovata subsp. sediminis]|uniref:Helicase n=1 Tax=Desulfosarcina ovata subsp. sediminis TaxID=885957 RepID=A0A5K7ZN96_9BACT|nr:helix-turn-helix domain-containing protein [Desulfosarcina ovata]BBO82641.1 helicase [Desulfosarcina ovata subsp. sediminis]